MFSIAILTALALSLAATAAQANEDNAHESPDRLDLAPRPAHTLQVPAYIVMSDKDRARADLPRSGLTTVTIVENKSLREKPTSAGDL